MTQTIDTAQTPVATETDLVSAIQRVLQASNEPLTVSKIKTALPSPHRSTSPEQLTEILQRQVAANVLIQYPKYRSQQDRFWDRPMPVHVAFLLRATLEEGALTASEVRRKLPAYAQNQSEEVLQQEVAQGRLHRHPRAGRGGDRFGVRPPDPKDYLRSELAEVFASLEKFGFTQEQLRVGALELLHDEEWAAPLAAANAAEADEERTRSEQPVASDSSQS